MVTDLPGAPSREANGLDDSQDKLGSEDEEKCHEIKGAVSPEKGEEMTIMAALAA